MLFLYDNLVAFSIFALTSAYAWIYGGIQAQALLPTIPWITLIVSQVMICFPQRDLGESTYDARRRVWGNIRHDPLSLILLAFTLLLMIPFFNTGLCPNCDYVAINILKQDPNPPIPFLPFCVNRAHHLTVVMWFVPSFLALLAMRHALLPRGKRFLVELIVWNGFALSLIGILQQATGATAPLWSTNKEMFKTSFYFFSTFGYPNMAGDYFTTLFGLSLACWRYHISYDDLIYSHHDRSGSHGRRFWRRHLFLIPAFLFFVSTYFTLSRASIILCTTLAVIFCLHSFISAFSKLPKAKRFRFGVIGLVVIVLISGFSIAFMPLDVENEIKTLNTRVILDRVTGRGQYHARVATEIWKENWAFGCGGWGYKHLCLSKMTPEELKDIQKVGGINVHNDHLQFLAEHGLVGFACLIAIFALLIAPLYSYWKKAMVIVNFSKSKHRPPRPRAIFVIPAPTFFILMTAIATIIHAFGDCPLRSPAVLSLFFISLATMEGYLPTLNTSTSHKSDF